MKKFVMKFKNLGKAEEGASVVVVALTFTFLIAVLALVIDFGMAYYKAGEVQNAADASVLAGASLLPVDVQDAPGILVIKDMVAEYASKNGFIIENYEDIVLGSENEGRYTTVNVTLRNEERTYFSKLFGLDNISLSRSAKAKIAPAERVGGTVPFGIKENVLKDHLESGYTQNIALKFGGGGGDTGDFGAINLDGVRGGGANDVEMWLTYGYEPSLTAGEDVFPVETGAMVGPINNAIETRYNSCTHYPENGGCTFDQFHPDCPRVLIVLVVENVSKHHVIIKGFAAFVLEPLMGDGHVYGSLINLTVPGVVSRDIELGDYEDYGLYNVLLID